MRGNWGMSVFRIGGASNGLDVSKLIFSDEDKKELASLEETLETFNMAINMIEEEKKNLTRKVARRMGLASARLEDLKTNGRSLVESSSLSKIVGYRAARIKGDPVALEDSHFAYLCGGEASGCGWVKGKPDTRTFNDITILSGSAGMNFYCWLCGGYMGKYDFVMS